MNLAKTLRGTKIPYSSWNLVVSFMAVAGTNCFQSGRAHTLPKIHICDIFFLQYKNLSIKKLSFAFWKIKISRKEILGGRKVKDRASLGLCGGRNHPNKLFESFAMFKLISVSVCWVLQYYLINGITCYFLWNIPIKIL